MKKVALLISLFTLVFAFTVTTVSAQKATGAQKATTEKSCEKKDAKCSHEMKACCAKEAAAKGCAKTCSEAEKAACQKEKAQAGATEAVPVPKSK